MTVLYRIPIYIKNVVSDSGYSVLGVIPLEQNKLYFKIPIFSGLTRKRMLKYLQIRI